jgi:tRNA pseudouridine55 synthase
MPSWPRRAASSPPSATADVARPERPDPGLHGVLVLSKPTGPTSHDIVALVRRLTGVKRVGHGGTLDPFAAGVLPVFVGRATRLVEYHMADEKGYRALVVFGARSSTDDLDGELTPGDAPPPSREAVEAALERFRGTFEQVPPDHSAVKVSGRKAYELARHGEKPELRPRTVVIHALDVEEWDAADPARPMARITVACSAGTYIRAIARDLGELLGCGAYLGALTRTRSGPFGLQQAHTLDAAREALAGGRAADLLLPPDAGLEAIPSVTVTDDELRTLARGQTVRQRGGDRTGVTGLLRVVDERGTLAAMARAEAGRLHPEKVFVSPGG